jgi:hypothetical protein
MMAKAIGISVSSVVVAGGHQASDTIHERTGRGAMLENADRC